MPLLFLERFPWPSLRTYTGLSGLALLGTIVSAYRALSQPEAGPGEPESPTAPVQTEPAVPARPSAGGPRARDVAQYLLSDSLFVWVSEAARAAAGERAGRRGPPCHPLCAGGVAGPGSPPGGPRVRGLGGGVRPRARRRTGGSGAGVAGGRRESGGAESGGDLRKGLREARRARGHAGVCGVGVSEGPREGNSRTPGSRLLRRFSELWREVEAFLARSARECC